MRELADAIRTYGRGIGKDIVKVDMFLNHRIDTGLLYRMGEALAEHFLPERPTMVLTVEASGIAIAIAAAHALGDLPVVFAKKSAAVNQSGDMAQASVYSFTHKCENHILVDRRYIPIGSRVLIVDDFLADGNAVRGMMDIVSQLGGKTVGVGIAIEKGFQDGGKTLRQMGVNLMSLAIVSGIEGGKILLAEDGSI
jgi:xanthine phosphoribosyltransferase